MNISLTLSIKETGKEFGGGGERGWGERSLQQQLEHLSWIKKYWISLRVTDLFSSAGFRLPGLFFGGARLKVGVRTGGPRLSWGLSRRLSLRGRWSLFLLSSRRIGTGWDACCSVGGGTEISIGAGWDVSIWTWGYDSIGASGCIRAGRVVEQWAHGRTCDWGGGGTCHGAADDGHGLHGHLLGLRKQKMTY